MGHDQLIESGRAFYWGTSEWRPEQLRHAYDVARREHLIPPTMEQPQYNMFVRRRVERTCLAVRRHRARPHRLEPAGVRPLTGKHNDGIAPDSRAALQGYEWIGSMFEAESGQEQIEKVRRLTPIAEELGGTMAQFALAWCLREDYVSSVTTGASRPEQVVENMKALDVLERYTPRSTSGWRRSSATTRGSRRTTGPKGWALGPRSGAGPSNGFPSSGYSARRPRTGGAQ